MVPPTAARTRRGRRAADAPPAIHRLPAQGNALQLQPVAEVQLAPAASRQAVPTPQQAAPPAVQACPRSVQASQLQEESGEQAPPTW